MNHRHISSKILPHPIFFLPAPMSEYFKLYHLTIFQDLGAFSTTRLLDPFTRPCYQVYFGVFFLGGGGPEPLANTPCPSINQALQVTLKCIRVELFTFYSLNVKKVMHITKLACSCAFGILQHKIYFFPLINFNPDALLNFKRSRLFSRYQLFSSYVKFSVYVRKFDVIK